MKKPVKYVTAARFPLVVVMKNFNLPYPFANAMDVINQVLFQINLASFTKGNLENADLHNIASQLKVTHYDCREMTGKNLHPRTNFLIVTLLLRTHKSAEQKLRSIQNIFDEKSTQQSAELNTRPNNGTVVLEVSQLRLPIMQR